MKHLCVNIDTKNGTLLRVPYNVMRIKPSCHWSRLPWPPGEPPTEAAKGEGTGEDAVGAGCTKTVRHVIVFRIDEGAREGSNDWDVIS